MYNDLVYIHVATAEPSAATPGSDCLSHCRLSVSQLLSELRMEMATWQLLHVLARDRVGEGGAETGPEVRLGSEGASDKELADDLFIRDSSVRQAQASAAAGGGGMVYATSVCGCSWWWTGWRAWPEQGWSTTQ